MEGGRSGDGAAAGPAEPRNRAKDGPWAAAFSGPPFFWLRFGSFTATPPPCQHFSPLFYGTCLLRSAPQPPRRLANPPPVCLAVCRSHLFAANSLVAFHTHKQGPEVTKHIMQRSRVRGQVLQAGCPRQAGIPRSRVHFPEDPVCRTEES